MTDSLSTFREWCEEALRFLTERHGFSVQKESARSNRYVVLLVRDDLKIAISGEGYGAIASVAYVASAGIEVSYQCLASDWEPFFGKSGKRRIRAMKKLPRRTQQEQIFDAAKIISERDRDILAGDFARLEAAAKRLQAIRERLKVSGRKSPTRR